MIEQSLTNEEIELLLNDIMGEPEKHDFPLCPKCSQGTKRLSIKQKSRRGTLIQIINPSNKPIYSGKVFNGLNFCFKCHHLWVE